MNSKHEREPNATPPGFYVIAREPGAEHPSLPTWANRDENPANFEAKSPIEVIRRPVDGVPGAFQLLNVLTADECHRLVAVTEGMGYLPDAAVSLPRAIRHNDNVTWMADDLTVNTLWQRCAHSLDVERHVHFGKRALGLNARFRFYRYREGDYFKPHTDGAWFGSAVVDNTLVTDAFGDRYSQLSFVLFLSDGFEGGRTEFYIDRDTTDRPAHDPNNANIIAVATPIGGAICFPHGLHPWHCLHSSEVISSGVKYIVRTDVLFEL